SLAHRWDQICMENEGPLDLKAIESFKLSDSIQLSLPEMEAFVASISGGENMTEVAHFDPIPQVRLLDDNRLPTIGTGEQYLPFRLAMLESWVAANLDFWLERHVREEDTCGELKELIQSYHQVASRQYSGRPEGASRMLLTIGELWVAMDKAAIHALPSLKLYEHEVPIEVWQALLLTSGVEAERLHRLEQYLLSRHIVARGEGRPSLFRSYGCPGSFSVEYFSASLKHQLLKIEIEAQAQTERQAKKEELRQLKDEYKMWMRQYRDRAECDEDTREEYGIPVQYHSHSCVRCGYLNAANSLRIDIQEWPLPQDDLKAQSTIFELSVPPIFSEWRDSTLYVINDVLLSKQSDILPQQPLYPLRDYLPLRKYFKTGRGYRVHLLSEAKPNMATHRQTLDVRSCTESDVCVNNGLRYQYFDGSRDWFLKEFLPTKGLSHLCTFSLPGRAHKLRRFLMRTW
ncbi:hypothetical protein CDV36_016575, partial [Fusarium kuroshium]